MEKRIWTVIFESTGSKTVCEKYIQVHSTGKELKEEFLPVSDYDGIAEIWFERMEDIPKVFSSENFKNIIAKDEAKFIDRGNIKWIYATENMVIVSLRYIP